MEELVLDFYGVEVRVSNTTGAQLCQRLRDTFPPEFADSSGAATEGVSYVLSARALPGNTACSGYIVSRDGIQVFDTAREEEALQWLCQDIDSTVAQRSRQMLFVHAGVVGWRGLAIVMPGRSHAGKSTLVAELVRRGAVYYSDEYAVLDDTGRVHPYRRSPALRGDEPPSEELRLMREDEPIIPLPIGLIVAGAYHPGSTWRPSIVRGAQAVLSLIDSTVLARDESTRTLRIAARVAPTVVTLQGLRGEATEVAARLLDLVDDALASHAIAADQQAASDLTADLCRVAEMRLRSQAGRPAPPDRRLLAARYVRLEDFLSPAEHQRLLEHALAHQAEFQESGIVGSRGENLVNYVIRKSRTLSGPRLEEMWGMFERRLHRVLPAIRQELGMSWFPLGDVERQLTAHGSGGFFAPHVDTGHSITVSRRISGVYYFHANPRRFTGGELKLYDTWVTPTGSTAAGTYTTLTPLDNSLVCFPSDTFHEVCPVQCETDAFADSRFTITIWFRERQALEKADVQAAT
jgi:Rps23 Pro-64 3,4-dihydroxylase Tpa1-like proline 4-hydroxylase